MVIFFVIIGLFILFLIFNSNSIPDMDASNPLLRSTSTAPLVAATNIRTDGVYIGSLTGIKSNCQEVAGLVFIFKENRILKHFLARKQLNSFNNFTAVKTFYKIISSDQRKYEPDFNGTFFIDNGIITLSFHTDDGELFGGAGQLFQDALQFDYTFKALNSPEFIKGSIMMAFIKY